MSAAAVMFHDAVSAMQGLSATEEKALDLLLRFGPLTHGELAERSGLAPASVSGLVDRLESKGFAHRRADPADGRRVLVEIDEDRVQGTLSPLFSDWAKELEALYGTFTVGELEAILRFMTEASDRQRELTARLTGEARK